VIRYEANGDVTVLADSFDGERFNACNDGMVHPDDGSIWFTDPGYGGLMNYATTRTRARLERKRSTASTVPPATSPW